MLIIRDIVFKGKVNFGEFGSSEEGIATNILTARLKRLEQQGIISKEKDSKNSSKNVYSLTDKGLDLLPVMVEMVAFAGKHDPGTGAPKKTLSSIRRNKEKFVNEMREHYKNQLKIRKASSIPPS